MGRPPVLQRWLEASSRRLQLAWLRTVRRARRLQAAIGALQPAAAAAAALKVPRWLGALIVGAVLFVVGSEGLVNLQDHPLHELAVIVVDVALVLGFAAWTAIRLLRNQRRLRDFVNEERITLLLVAMSLVLVPLVPRVGAAVVIARLAVSALGGTLETEIGRRAVILANNRPPLAVAFSFLAMIAVGTLLLTFPAATVNGQGASLVDAAFTISSATSVTGLTLHDTAGYWTPFGLAVILVWVQLGAIGIQSLAAAFAVLAGGRVPGRTAEGLDLLGLGGAVELGTTEGLKKLLTAVTGTTLGIELLGALALFSLWGVGALEVPAGYDDVAGALWWSVFNSISAFCHAGFVLTPDSLVPYVSNTAVNVVFITLIVLGSLGFAVMADLQQRELWRHWRDPRAFWSKTHIQTRVVLVGTLVLTVAGMLSFLAFEYNGAMSGLGLGGKLNASFLQSVTLRSAGLNSVDTSTISTPTSVLFMVFMFIGGGPGSTAGGVRITTAVVVIMAVRTMLTNRSDVEIYGRRMPQMIVYRSISIVLISGMMIALALVLLLATQDIAFEPLAFETFSAFGTVGLSMGVTSELDTFGRWLVTLLMYLGRVGPLTLALAIGETALATGYRYPEGRLAVG